MNKSELLDISSSSSFPISVGAEVLRGEGGGGGEGKEKKEKGVSRPIVDGRKEEKKRKAGIGGGGAVFQHTHTHITLRSLSLSQKGHQTLCCRLAVAYLSPPKFESVYYHSLALLSSVSFHPPTHPLPSASSF